MNVASCPDRHALRAFSSGELSGDRIREVAEHVDSCTSCQSILDAQSNDAEPVVAALRQPPAEPEYSNESEYRHALAFVQAIGRAENSVDDRSSPTLVARWTEMF